MNETERSSMEDISQIIAKQKRTKKIMMIAAIILALITVALILALTIPNLLKKDKAGSKKDPSYIFYTADYNENIYENSEYMALNRYVMFYNTATGVTEDINNFPDDKYLVFMSELVNAIIEGDAKKYNSMFSDKYLLANSDKVREYFTMQKLYDIVVTKHYTEEETIYSLEYKIMENNGTYRSDMPSDCSKAQYFLISDHAGKLLIDNLIVR